MDIADLKAKLIAIFGDSETDLSKHSDEALHELHQAIHSTLHSDAVHREPGWRSWGDRLEDEMRLRNLTFTDIDW